MRHSSVRIATLDAMKVLIRPRRAARLAFNCAIVVSLAPLTALSAAAAIAAPASPTAAVRHALPAELCDGHKWSLFGCRPDHHRVQQQDVGGSASDD